MRIKIAIVLLLVLLAGLWAVNGQTFIGRPLMPLNSGNSLLVGLEGYYRLDEVSTGVATVVREDSASTNDLSDYLVDALNYVSSTSGIITNATLHTSASRRLAGASTNTFRFGDIDFTLGFWVQISDNGCCDLYGLGRSTPGAATEFRFYYNIVAARYSWQVSSNGTVLASVNATSYGMPANNTWAYVVVSHDAANDTISIQVNNGTEDTAAHTTGVAQTSTLFMVGGINNGLANAWRGRFDEIGVWSRILTAEEKTDLYNGGSGLTYPFQ